MQQKKKDLTRKTDVVGEARDLAFWGVLGFSMIGIFFPPSIINVSIKCSVSFDSCLLINLLYV